MIILAHRFHENDKARFEEIAPTFFGWEVLENPQNYALDDFQIIIANGGEYLDDKYYDLLPNLRVIFVSAVGYDALNLDMVRQRGIMLANTPNINTDDVADLAMGLLIAGERNIGEADRLVRNNEWKKAEKLIPSFRLRGRKLGIYGMGAIGQAIAERSVPFGLEISWHGPRPKPEIQFEYVPTLLELAQKCDILMVACALNDETRYSVDKTILHALGKDGVIVNIARGAIIVEDDLVKALREREILGGCLDVFDPEPTDGSKWANISNVVITPHFSGKTRAARETALMITFDNILRYLKGEELLHRII